MRILVVDDDQSTAEFIGEGLKQEGFAVDVAFTGEDGQEMAGKGNYDVLVLDVNLPQKNGFDVCLGLRKNKVATPILMLTGRAGIDDRVNGLNCGADDYLIKPFAFEELVARIRALLRREKQVTPSILKAGVITMNISSKLVTSKRKKVNLTSREFSILEYLLHHRNFVVTRTTLEQHIWNQDFVSESNLVDVYIKRVRQKIGPDGENLIQTVRGSGYILVTKDTK